MCKSAQTTIVKSYTHKLHLKQILQYFKHKKDIKALIYEKCKSKRVTRYKNTETLNYKTAHVRKFRRAKVPTGKLKYQSAKVRKST